MPRSILMVSRGSHQSHIAFAESVGAQVYFLGKSYHGMRRVWRHFVETFQIPYADVYISEGGPALYPIAFRLRLGRKSKLILLDCDSLFPEIDSGSRMKRKYFGLVKNQIDAVIAVSECLGQLTGKYVDTPIRIANPFISDERFEQLSFLKPDLDSHNLVSMGVNFGSKGTDILLDAFRLVRKRFADSRLFLLGKPAVNTPPIIEDGVECPGYVSDILPYFSSSALYVQASRYDAFSVATLEAMRAGLPPLVTEGVGTKELIRKIDASLVCSISSFDLAQRVIEYFDKPSYMKKEFSDKARILGGHFSSKECIPVFQKQFSDLMSILFN